MSIAYKLNELLKNYLTSFSKYWRILFITGLIMMITGGAFFLFGYVLYNTCKMIIYGDYQNIIFLYISSTKNNSELPINVIIYYLISAYSLTDLLRFTILIVYITIPIITIGGLMVLISSFRNRRKKSIEVTVNI